mmetsp:Transcript_6131/g.13094  ORF Transcript_6131/g.13094 Transcript_6131/m.13094 type:complete len:90 (-) Transcript_6131:486-755(-)
MTRCGGDPLGQILLLRLSYSLQILFTTAPVKRAQHLGHFFTMQRIRIKRHAHAVCSAASQHSSMVTMSDSSGSRQAAHSGTPCVAPPTV